MVNKIDSRHPPGILVLGGDDHRFGNSVFRRIEGAMTVDAVSGHKVGCRRSYLEAGTGLKDCPLLLHYRQRLKKKNPHEAGYFRQDYHRTVGCCRYRPAMDLLLVGLGFHRAWRDGSVVGRGIDCGRIR